MPLDIYAKYNKQLAQGIVEVNAKNYDKATNLFNAAEKTLIGTGLNKIESYLYRGATHVQKAKDYI